MANPELNSRQNKPIQSTHLAGVLLGAAVLVLAILALAGYLNRSEFDDSAPVSTTVTAAGAPGSGSGGFTNLAHPRPAPRFELPQPDGKPFQLESLRGNAVVVHFWASWCPPCLTELPHWLEFASHWKGKPVRFVAISLDQGWPEALKILPAANLPSNTASVLDHEQKLPDAFGTYQYPETYLLDSELRIVSKWVGAQNWASPAIESAIQSVLPKS